MCSAHVPANYIGGIVPPALRAYSDLQVIHSIRSQRVSNPTTLRFGDTTDISDILRLWRDNSTYKYYCTTFVIFEFH